MLTGCSGPCTVVCVVLLLVSSFPSSSLFKNKYSSVLNAGEIPAVASGRCPRGRMGEGPCSRLSGYAWAVTPVRRRRCGGAEQCPPRCAGWLRLALGRDCPQESMIHHLPTGEPGDSSRTFAWLWSAVISGRGSVKKTCQFCTVCAMVETVLETGATTANGDEA